MTLVNHNRARAHVGVAPIEWNATIAAYARDYANKRAADCDLIHSGGPYGENLAMGPRGGPFVVEDAVTMWALERHNLARAAVGVAPLKWSDRIAAYARRWADKRTADCRPLHSTGGYYGENLALGPWGGPFLVADAVNMWVGEKKYYDHETNSCHAPPGESCGHYMAVVCRRSTHVGCAKRICDDGGIFIICDYGPPGRLGEPPY
ncbi:hypothetical protein C5167_037413 [Papaver somniferum]|uniref:SCP domain-containing protein n=1 Tax=Papaver somniferum TaxID=3469 RepID=A0A4Y7I9Z8_PAPSO|nr:hypothetical protein C5167_037413 [Papaver somniferum]